MDLQIIQKELKDPIERQIGNINRYMNGEWDKLGEDLKYKLSKDTRFPFFNPRILGILLSSTHKKSDMKKTIDNNPEVNALDIIRYSRMLDL